MNSDEEHAHHFDASFGYRWFESKRMFSGSSEDAATDPQINDSHFIDLSLRYSFNPRFSAAVTLPYVSHDRAQLVRRLNPARSVLGQFHTQTSGIGDIRVEGDAWIFDPASATKGNIQVGLGVSLPTGEKDAQDTFSIGGSSLFPSSVILSVDPSIQPGSGGLGIYFDFYAYREIVPRLNAFLSGLYVSTPAEKYTPTASSVSGYTTYSITDSYLTRGGLEYLLWPKHSLYFSLAGRMEGVPVRDPIGGSDGFRRPGYSVSIDPGVAASWKSWTLAMNVPIAVLRNRDQNTTEKAMNMPAAAAGFADFQFMFSLSRRF